MGHSECFIAFQPLFCFSARALLWLAARRFSFDECTPELPLYSSLSLLQNYVTVGVSNYEAVAAAGTLSVEHTSVAEILASVAR